MEEDKVIVVGLGAEIVDVHALAEQLRAKGVVVIEEAAQRREIVVSTNHGHQLREAISAKLAEASRPVFFEDKKTAPWGKRERNKFGNPFKKR